MYKAIEVQELRVGMKFYLGVMVFMVNVIMVQGVNFLLYYCRFECSILNGMDYCKVFCY